MATYLVKVNRKPSEVVLTKHREMFGNYPALNHTEALLEADSEEILAKKIAKYYPGSSVISTAKVSFSNFVRYESKRTTA